MPKSSNQKLKLIYLMKILLERTDVTLMSTNYSVLRTPTIPHLMIPQIRDRGQKLPELNSCQKI